MSLQPIIRQSMISSIKIDGIKLQKKSYKTSIPIGPGVTLYNQIIKKQLAGNGYLK